MKNLNFYSPSGRRDALAEGFRRKKTGLNFLDVIHQLKNESPLIVEEEIDITYLDKDQRELLATIK